MEGGVAVFVARVHVGVQFFDEKLDGGEHAGRARTVCVGGKAFAVSDAGRSEQRRRARAAGRQRGQA